MEQTNKLLSFPILLIWREEAEQRCCVCASKGGREGIGREQGGEGGRRRGEWELLARRQQLSSSANVWRRINIGSQAALVVLLLLLLLLPSLLLLSLFSLNNPFSLQYHHLTWRTFLSRPVFCESILSSLESGFWLIWKWPFMMRSWWCLNEVRARFVFA